MSKVNDEMYYRRNHPFPISIAQEYVNNSEHEECIIIVEGDSDKDFYKNTNVDVLNKAFYIYAKRNKYDNKTIVGKDAVIDSYFIIKELSHRNNFKALVVFIVDKDFFGISLNSKKYYRIKSEKNAKLEDIDNFTILDCHSHECYFILDNNLKQIFSTLNMEEKLDDFKRIFKENIDDFSDYFAYKCILEDDNPKRPRPWYFNSNEIINFNFEFKDNKIIYNKDDLKNAIDEMKKEVNLSENKKSLEEQYKQMKNNFCVHPELLRGHTLFDFLQCYLNHYGKSLKRYNEYSEKYEYNHNIIHKMEIPIHLKILKLYSGKYKKENNE